VIGTTLGQFRILAQLGQGGMGEVFLAEDTTLRRRVAIKRLSSVLGGQPQWVARLRREAIALAAVNHPNVVTVHAVSEVDGIPFVVMELVEGSTIQRLLPPEGFEPERVVELAIPVVAQEPDGRPGSARLILEELTRCQRREPSPAPSTAPVPKAVSAPPVDMTIAGLLIRGRHLWNKRTEDSLRTALRCFQEVTDLDPLQPKAWLGIADTLNLLSNYGIAPPGDSLIRVRAAVAHAVQLEGESGDALRALALAAWQFEFNWEEADALYRRAIELDPTSALTHHWYGVLLGVTRRFDQGIAHFAQAEALDPLSLISLATRGWFTLFAGRPEEAHAILRRVFSLDGSYFPAYWFDGQALAVLGRHEDAIHSLTRATELAGRTSRMLGYLGYVTGLAGRREEALALLAELRGRAADDYVPPYFQALVLAGVAERAEALAELRRALTSRDTMVRDIAIDTPWWSFREEPAYQMLLRELKLLA